MDNKCSRQTNVVNLKQLPPIDPLRVMNSSSKGDKKNYSVKAAKVLTPNPGQGMKLVESDEAPTETNSANDAGSLVPSNKNRETCGNTAFLTNSANDGMKKGYAKSNLYEICAANHWKPPIFDCCKEEGPSHRRKFTFKVIVEIEGASRNIIECYGAPHGKKKTAADHAAEGALWYLKHIGLVMENQ